MKRRTFVVNNPSTGPRGPMPSTTSTLAREFRAKRIRLGLSQDQCADFIRTMLCVPCSTATICKIEKGEELGQRSQSRITVATFLSRIYHVERRDGGKLTITEA